MSDPFDLERFVVAQSRCYADALAEVRAGQKRSHWMWFVFPQVHGLGHSDMAKRYAIRSLDEARAYLAHPVLGPRLRECAEAALSVRGRTAEEIFGWPDHMKLRSSMTLFALAAEEGSPFARVLEAYFAGEKDDATVSRLSDAARAGRARG